MYFGKSVINEGFFDKFKKKKEEPEKIDYDKIVKQWIQNPKELNVEDIVDVGYALKSNNISESKFKSIIKSNLNNFDYYFSDPEENAKPPINNADWFSKYQEEFLQKEKVKKVYYIVADSDVTIYYCKENNKLYKFDYKRGDTFSFSYFND